MAKKKKEIKTKKLKKAKKKAKKLTKSISDLKKLKEEYEKVLREKGQEIMKEAIEAFFKANPKVTGVAWSQYTPHFNDGDPCVFGVNEPGFSVSEVDKSDFPAHGDDGEGGFYGSYGFSLYDLKDPYYVGKDWAVKHNEAVKEAMAKARVGADTFADAAKSFRATVGVAGDDLFLAAFGDHVKVLVTPDDITVEEYDHD